MPTGTPIPTPSFTDPFNCCGASVGAVVGARDVFEGADEDEDEEGEEEEETEEEEVAEADLDVPPDTAGPDGLGVIVVTASPALIVKAFPGEQTHEESVAFRASSKQQYPSVSLPHMESTESMLYPTTIPSSATLRLEREDELIFTKHIRGPK